MSKLKRYLGLVAAVALLLVAFSPVETKRPISLTLVDQSLVTSVLVHNSGQLAFWDQATRNLAAYVDCQRTQRHTQAVMAWASPAKCAWHMYGDLQHYSWKLGEPKLTALYELAGKEQKESDPYAAPSQELTAQLVAYLDASKPSLAGMIYAAHGAVVLAALLMIIFRERVGTIIWLPFSLLAQALGSASKGAKNIHERI